MVCNPYFARCGVVALEGLAGGAQEGPGVPQAGASPLEPRGSSPCSPRCMGVESRVHPMSNPRDAVPVEPLEPLEPLADIVATNGPPFPPPFPSVFL